MTATIIPLNIISIATRQITKTLHIEDEGKVDFVRIGEVRRGYAGKVFHDAETRTRWHADLAAKREEAAHPVVKRLRNGAVIRGSISARGERVSVSMEIQADSDIDGTAFVSADENRNLSIILASGAELNLTCGQYYELRKLLAGRAIDQLLGQGEEWCQAA